MEDKFIKIGTIDFVNLTIFFANNDLSIIKDNKDQILTEDDLMDWAMLINSPWSQNHEKYEIKCNCKDAYTEIDKNTPIWKCEYTISGIDMIRASVIGYGNTEEESLKNCKNLFKYLQENYNKENESF